jgi:hypothetical protein
MATAIRQLPQQSPPSEVVVPGLLDGLKNVNRLVQVALQRDRATGNDLRARRVARKSK